MLTYRKSTMCWPKYCFTITGVLLLLIIVVLTPVVGPRVPSIQRKTNLPQVFIIFLAQFFWLHGRSVQHAYKRARSTTNDYRPNLFICKKSSRTGHASCARPWTRLCGASVDRASSMQIRYRVTNTRCNYRVLFHIPTTCYDFPFESLQSSSRCGGLLLKLIVTVNSTCVRLGNLYGRRLKCHLLLPYWKKNIT